MKNGGWKFWLSFSVQLLSLISVVLVPVGFVFYLDEIRSIRNAVITLDRAIIDSIEKANIADLKTESAVVEAIDKAVFEGNIIVENLVTQDNNIHAEPNNTATTTNSDEQDTTTSGTAHSDTQDPTTTSSAPTTTSSAPTTTSSAPTTTSSAPTTTSSVTDDDPEFNLGPTTPILEDNIEPYTWWKPPSEIDSLGYGDDGFWFTLAIGQDEKVDNRAKWNFYVEDGTYELQAWIPADWATAHVQYNIWMDINGNNTFDNGERLDGPWLDQQRVSGWQPLGVYALKGRVQVVVEDTGTRDDYRVDGAVATRLAVDALRLVPTE